MAGDPHVRIQIPEEEAVCFDVHPGSNACVVLLSDNQLNLRVTGKMANNQKKDRLSAIGIETNDGTQIEVQSQSIIINGMEIALNEDKTLKFQDVTIISQKQSNPTNVGCEIEITNGPAFKIHSKV